MYIVCCIVLFSIAYSTIQNKSSTGIVYITIPFSNILIIVLPFPNCIRSHVTVRANLSK